MNSSGAAINAAALAAGVMLYMDTDDVLRAYPRAILKQPRNRELLRDVLRNPYQIAEYLRIAAQ